MPFTVFVVPFGVIAWTAALIILSRFGSRIGTVGALVAVAITFGYFDLVRFDGMSGDFKTTINWRWQGTPEDAFLASRKSSEHATSSNAGEPLGKVLWSQFRGPNCDGHVPGVVLDGDWKAHLPKEIWRRKVGPGWSSYVVAGNRVFTQEQRGEKEIVVCYDARTGDERWIHESGARFSESMGGVGPRATPALSGGNLYAQGATGLLQCLDPLSGSLKWERDLTKDAGRAAPMWGFASSPLVVSNRVIAYAGGTGANQIFAYDSASGEPKWSAPAGDNSYSSPQLAKLAGRDVVLLLTNSSLAAVDAATGTLRRNCRPWKPATTTGSCSRCSSTVRAMAYGNGHGNRACA